MTANPQQRSRIHGSLREGILLGVLVATGIWLWIAIVDFVAGQPLRTFTVLGGVVEFTILHYLLNVLYGIVIVSAIHRAARVPSLVIAVAFGFLIVELAFAMLTVLLSHLGLGQLAWIRILGANLFGVAIAFALLSRRHPLAAEIRSAEEAESE